jgi:hypothetical protein
MKLGIELLQNDKEALATIWDGYACNSHPADVAQAHLELLQRMLVHVNTIRLDAAISGAMRWPWSQEFKIMQPYAQGE